MSTNPTGIPGRFIDIHVIQSIPYANLNRDDTNSVKTVQWGGTPRTRVSSQCWKRACRLRLEQTLGESALRTRRIGERVERHLINVCGWPADLARTGGQQVAVSSSIKDEAAKKGESELRQTAAMVYVPEQAIAELAAIAEAHRDALTALKPTKKPEAALPTQEIDAVLRTRNGVINLFGRMLAELDNADVDGAAQVAHAFTTHSTDTEVDYFSAVDDVTALWDDESGSAHMGTAEHSAGVLYRYATLDLDDLLRNLGGDVTAARELAAAFVDAFVLSVPAAKKNSTAPHTVPDLVHIAVRSDRPVSYAAAFEQPVHHGTDGGHSAPSRTALADYANAINELISQDGIIRAAHASIEKKAVDGLGERVTSYRTLISGAVDAALGTAATTETV